MGIVLVLEIVAGILGYVYRADVNMFFYTDLFITR